jgi:hypothetical protein
MRDAMGDEAALRALRTPGAPHCAATHLATMLSRTVTRRGSASHTIAWDTLLWQVLEAVLVL